MDDTRPKFLNSVTEHPDVQRLIKQVIRSDEENKQLQAENKRLKEALKKYGHHCTPEVCCEASLKESGKCTCGFEQALEDIDPNYEAMVADLTPESPK